MPFTASHLHHLCLTLTFFFSFQGHTFSSVHWRQEGNNQRDKGQHGSFEKCWFSECCSSHFPSDLMCHYQNGKLLSYLWKQKQNPAYTFKKCQIYKFLRFSSTNIDFLPSRRGSASVWLPATLICVCVSPRRSSVLCVVAVTVVSPCPCCCHRAAGIVPN